MAFSLDEEASAQVLRQVEFYFSESNLPGDRFLRKCIDEAADGLVSIPLVCSFGRMRSHLKLKEKGPDNVPTEITAAVAEVLRKSTVLRVSEDGQKVGRIAPLLHFADVQAAVASRSIAVGPLCWKATMEEVETFFSQHAKVISVRLPRHAGGKAFCGYALVELLSDDEATKALKLKLSYDGVNELEIKSKKDFDAEMEKKRILNSQQLSRISPEEMRSRKNDGEGEPYPKGLIVAFSLQKMDSKDGVVAEKGTASQGQEATTTSEGQAKESDTVSWEDIKGAFKVFGDVKYVDFTRGEMTGFVRFEKSEEAEKARTAAVLAEAGGIVVKDCIATLEAVEGEAEEQYWAKLREFQGRVRGRSGGRGGSHGREGREPRDRHQRDKKSDRLGKKRGQQQDAGKSEGDAKQLGKHKRFEDVDSGDEGEPPSKQNKSEEDVDVTCRQSDRADVPM